MKKVVFILFICCIVMAYAGIADGDVVINQTTSKEAVELPADFDIEAATAEMKAARKSGNAELAAQLHLQINQWWIDNRIKAMDAPEHGTNNINRKYQLPYLQVQVPAVRNQALPHPAMDYSHSNWYISDQL